MALAKRPMTLGKEAYDISKEAYDISIEDLRIDLCEEVRGFGVACFVLQVPTSITAPWSIRTMVGGHDLLVVQAQLILNKAMQMIVGC